MKQVENEVYQAPESRSFEFLAESLICVSDGYSEGGQDEGEM